MLANQGIFNLAARSEANAALARNTVLLHAQPEAQAAKFAIGTASGPATSGGWNSMTNTSISPAAKLKAFLKDVLDKTDDNLISDDMLKRLDKASKSDNKEISAEKLRQAKAKLQSLRMQAQMAAATGDPKTLRRIAQEAAMAAREVANAVRGLASGIATTALATDGSASGGVAEGTTGATDQAAAQGETAQAGDHKAASADASSAEALQPGPRTADGAPADPKIADAGKDGAAPKDQDTAYTQPVPSGEDPKSWGREALRKLSDEAHTAIAQARGLIAFCAQAARSARKNRPDPDEDKAYRDLQSAVSDAEHDVDGSITAAGKEISDGNAERPIDAAGTASGEAGTSAVDSGIDVIIDSTTVLVQITTVVAVGTDLTV
jgi:hypothetical protein